MATAELEPTIGDEVADAPELIDGSPEELPDVDPNLVMDNIVQLAPTEVEVVNDGDTTRTWGPYSDYQFVQTSWGEYGVPKGKVLFFQVEEVWNNKEKRFESRPMPYYVDAGAPLIAVKPGLPDTIER